MFTCLRLLMGIGVYYCRHTSLILKSRHNWKALPRLAAVGRRGESVRVVKMLYLCVCSAGHVNSSFKLTLDEG